MIPNAAMAMNHARQMGPNRPATLAVPLDWAMNRPIKITRLVTMTTPGVTTECNAGAVFRPSIAESTDMAGVITASP
jgi:hypothetical protein